MPLLDYTIDRDVDRLEYVKNLLDISTTTPSPSTLEGYATYILYGHDENGKNFFSTHEDDTRKTPRRVGKRNTAPLEDFNQGDLDLRPKFSDKRPTIERPKYDRDGTLISVGDSDIPGMTQLWDTIDRLNHLIRVSQGKETDATILPITSPRALYLARHWLTDMRQMQYDLKEMYRRPMRFQSVTRSPTPPTDFSGNASYWVSREELEEKLAAPRHRYDPSISHTIEGYETRTLPSGEIQYKWIISHQAFDWENPRHIAALIDHYSAIYEENFDNLLSWGRTLIMDFDLLFDECGFTPSQEYVITRAIDGATLKQIKDELYEKFGIDVCLNTISNTRNSYVPRVMAQKATKKRLLKEATKRKACLKCGNLLPVSSYFFTVNSGHVDGLSNICKDCANKKKVK